MIVGASTAYVFSFEGVTVEVTRQGSDIRLDSGSGLIALPLAVMEAIARLDLASLVPAEVKEG